MKISRNYHLSDARFLEYSDVIAATLPDDLADFTAFDATVTTDYVTRLQQAIADAKSISPDGLVMDEVAEETQKVETAMNDCYDDYKTVAFFVRKAFPDNPALQNQFGKNDVQRARKSQPTMVAFMESLAKTAEKYSTDLVQAGCPQALIDGLAGKAAALHDANIVQETSKKDRGLTTQDRVEKLNKVYDLLKPLHEMARIIYRDNPPKLKIYTMPQPAKKTEAVAETPPATDTPE